MYLMEIFAGLVMLLFAVFAITQVFVPAVRGTPMLPMFNREERRREREARAADRAVHETATDIDVARRRREAEELRASSQDTKP